METKNNRDDPLLPPFPFSTNISPTQAVLSLKEEEIYSYDNLEKVEGFWGILKVDTVFFWQKLVFKQRIIGT